MKLVVLDFLESDLQSYVLVGFWGLRCTSDSEVASALRVSRGPSVAATSQAGRRQYVGCEWSQF